MIGMNSSLVMDTSAQSQLEARYPRPGSVIRTNIDTLYLLSRKNDQLLCDIFRKSQENEQLEQKVEKLKAKIPNFIINWWNSNQGSQQMMVFLQQLNLALKEEIQQLRNKIMEQKCEQQVNEADYEEQIKQRVELQKKLQCLNSKLQQLRAQERNKSQIQLLYEQATGIQMKQHKALQSILRVAVIEMQDMRKRIFAKFPQKQNPSLSSQDKEKKYYSALQFMLTHLHQRRKVLQDKLKYLKQQSKQIVQEMEANERSRKAKNELNESILKKRSQLSMLNEKLRIIKESQEDLKVKEVQMQEKYTQEMMDKVVPMVNHCSKRSEELLIRVLQMTKDVQNRPSAQITPSI